MELSTAPSPNPVSAPFGMWFGDLAVVCDLGNIIKYIRESIHALFVTAPSLMKGQIVTVRIVSRLSDCEECHELLETTVSDCSTVATAVSDLTCESRHMWQKSSSPIPGSHRVQA
jgi:hypothetical protein